MYNYKLLSINLNIKLKRKRKIFLKIPRIHIHLERRNIIEPQTLNQGKTKNSMDKWPSLTLAECENRKSDWPVRKRAEQKLHAEFSVGRSSIIGAEYRSVTSRYTCSCARHSLCTSYPSLSLSLFSFSFHSLRLCLSLSPFSSLPSTVSLSFSLSYDSTRIPFFLFLSAPLRTSVSLAPFQEFHPGLPC